MKHFIIIFFAGLIGIVLCAFVFFSAKMLCSFVYNFFFVVVNFYNFHMKEKIGSFLSRLIYSPPIIIVGLIKINFKTMGQQL